MKSPFSNSAVALTIAASLNLATIATAPSARNAVATEDGTAYLADSKDGTILVVEPAN